MRHYKKSLLRGGLSLGALIIKIGNYHMNTPVFCEMVRLLNNKMNVSRNTVYNWFVKGSDHLKKVLPVLKEKLLAKGAVVNCDETWCRINYHTFIETYKMCGVSTLEYFKEFFKAVMQGRTDYERSALPLC